MDLDVYVKRLREQLVVTAEAGGEPARAVADRLIAPLEAAVRLMLLEAMSEAAAEVTRELAPGAVELRLVMGEPEFVVRLPTSEAGDAKADGGGALLAPVPVEDGGQARVNLRLPEGLKGRVERAAEREGLSVNAWLVRAAAAAAERGPEPVSPTEGRQRRQQSFKGWGR